LIVGVHFDHRRSSRLLSPWLFTDNLLLAWPSHCLSPRGRTSRPDGGFDYGVASLGSRTVNTEPFPGSLVTVTSPPIMRASLREMARPSPVPPYRRAVSESAWVKSWNSFACCSAVIPMPVSATASSTQSRPSATLRIRSATSPSFVNLQALLKR